MAALPLQLVHTNDRLECGQKQKSGTWSGGLEGDCEGDQALSKRILVVDDDSDIRQVLLDRLSSYGYVVETAINGREALDALPRGAFDGLLLDIQMPEVDGFEVLRRSRSSYPQVPVVMITATMTREREAQAIAAGARACLVKPLDPGQLKKALDQYFGPPEP